SKSIAINNLRKSLAARLAIQSENSFLERIPLT
ncbi:MAG: hypothetical protein ACI9G1_000227, partial [Pirellulaceae bacterium]